MDAQTDAHPLELFDAIHGTPLGLEPIRPVGWRLFLAALLFLVACVVLTVYA